MTFFTIILTCYVIGSIASGPIAAKIFKLGNLRDIGSGNIGATNVLRTGHKGAALVTLLGDILKGVLASYVAQKIYFLHPDSVIENTTTMAILGGFMAFVGHLYPVFLKFKGGKGVATYLGALWGLGWQFGIIASLLWLMGGYLSKISSVGALGMALFMPVIIYFYQPDLKFVAFIVAGMSLILWIKHATNIRRIFTGEESKISFLRKKS